MLLYKKIFDITENDIIFDVGTNCGSFVKALLNLQIKKKNLKVKKLVRGEK